MKIKPVFLFLPVFLFGGSLLNDLKQKELNFDKQQSIQESKDTEKSWISPVIFKYSYTKDNTLGDIKTTNKTLSISVNQPVFKSGAIYYSIKYAKHSKSYNLLNIELKKRELVKQALDLAYDYNIALLNRNILLLNIENTEIDIQKKKEDFLSGVGDSALLNNAVLQLNTLKLSLADIDSSIKKIKYSFENISSLNIGRLKLPVFKLVDLKEYLKNNLDLLKQEKLKKVKYDLYKMQVGDQLLSVNLNASYNWQDVSYSKNTPLLQDDKNNFYRVGLSITLPINFNAQNKIEKTKIEYMKSQLAIEDTKLQLENMYKSTLNQILTIDKKIKIYQNNIKVYDDLIASTLDSVKAGNATESDLKILQNSRKTMFINIDILKLQKQKLMLSLYYKLNTEKTPF